MKLPFARYVKAHHAALCAGALVAAAVFFLAGAGLRLLWGPVSLGPLHGALAGAIHNALPGIALDYDRAALEWNRDQNRVNLVVLGARLYDSHGLIVATAPKAAIGLAAAPLTRGEFAVRRITLVGVALTLVHMRSGRIRLGNQKDSGDDVIGRIRDVIDAHGGGGSALESFAVRDAVLGLVDEVSGLHVTARKASLDLLSRGPVTAANFDADVEMSGRTSHVTAGMDLPAGRTPARGAVNVTGLDLRALAANAPMFAGAKAVPLVADASAQVRFGADGGLAAADFDITAKGEIPFATLAAKALHVQAARLVGHYDGAARRLVVSSASLAAREARASLKGTGDFILGADGGLERIHAELSGRNIALDMPGVFAQPVGYQSLTLTGDYLTGPRQFNVARFALAAPGFALDGGGTLTLNDAGAPGLVARAGIPALPARTLLRYWPLPVAPGARKWIDANIFAGTIGPLKAETNFPPGMMDREILPEDSIRMTFAMKDVEGSYLEGLTHATGVAGEAVLTGDTFRADLSTGRIGALAASRGTAVIPNLHQPGTVGEFGVHVDGAMTDVMTLIDMKPLNYPTRFGIDPRQTGGTVSADLAFKVPMLANLPVDDVGISVKAAVSDFAVTLGARTRITRGAVTFDIDNDHLRQVGTVNLADSRLSVDWTEDFKTADPVTSRLAVKGVMTEAGRAALNINLQRYFRGAVPVTADITGHRGSLARVDAAVDFTPATLSVPIVNLEKTPGQPATGRVVANFGPGNTLTDESIRIGGPVLNASGTATFNRDGELTVLNFPSVRMGPLNDLSFQLTRGADGNDYTLRGHSLDGSKIGRNGTGAAPGGASGSPPDDTPEGRFHISARLDRLAMRDGVAIAPFSMDMAGNGNRPAALQLSGDLTMGSQHASIAASLETTGTARKVTLTSGDAGLLARGLFAFESMRGGTLSATVNLPGQADSPPGPAAATPDFTGVLTVKDFQMVNQPLLARLFSAGSLTGMGDLMGGEGMTMEELNMPFTSKNNVISVDGARAVGRAIGASADGYIDRPKGMIALKGSLIPAYGLNSLISNVPLIGDILASKKGEGIFGVTYSLTGDAEHPDLSTNPLSMLTPGILRRVFEGHIPNAANAPSNAPPRTSAPKTPATP